MFVMKFLGGVWTWLTGGMLPLVVISVILGACVGLAARSISAALMAIGACLAIALGAYTIGHRVATVELRAQVMNAENVARQRAAEHVAVALRDVRKMEDELAAKLEAAEAEDEEKVRIIEKKVAVRVNDCKVAATREDMRAIGAIK